MDHSLTFSATIHPGGRSIIPEDKDLVGDFLEAHKPGQVFTVKICKYKKPRSKGAKDEEGNQLGFFFGVLVPIWMRDIDFTIHKYESYYNIMNLFSFEMITSANGKPKKKLVHVDDDMPVEKMTKLIEDCQIHAATEHGIYIPDPDPRKSKRWRARFLAGEYSK